MCIFTPSLFFVNPDRCVENCVRIFICPFSAYATFLNETPDPLNHASCKVGPPWIGFVALAQSSINRIEICGI